MEPMREKDIRTVLHASNATAEQIAEKMNVQPSTIAYTLKGSRRNRATIEKFANTVGAHVAEQIKTALMPQAN